MSEPLRGVGLTAVWVAMLRAAESERADRLIDDQLARVFVEAAMPDGSAPWGAWPPGSSEFLAIRARFYDDRLLEACAAGVRQVGQLAAGLDTRAFRLHWPDGVRLFELDLPELFAFKEKVLTGQGARARCERVTVGSTFAVSGRSPCVEPDSTRLCGPRG
jgi:methyltransferase (TIGR00027 family)